MKEFHVLIRDSCIRYKETLSGRMGDLFADCFLAFIAARCHSTAG